MAGVEPKGRCPQESLRRLRQVAFSLQRSIGRNRATFFHDAAPTVLAAIAELEYGPHRLTVFGGAGDVRVGLGEDLLRPKGGGIPMANRRWRWYLGLLVGLILTPPLLWLLVVAIAPTGWAKGKVVAILEARSGRRVRLEGLSVRLMGGIRLTKLEIGSPKDLGSPWLKAADIRLDIGPLQIVRGHLRPTRVNVNGVDLRVLRRSDGTVELADLIQPIAVPSNGLISWKARSADHIAVSVRQASVTVLDEPTQTRLHLQDVEGEGYCEGPRAVVDRLRGNLNGGAFRFAAQLDRTASALSWESQFRAMM